MKSTKQLPHEWAKSTENQHHRLRLQVSDANGTRLAAGSYSSQAGADYVSSLYPEGSSVVTVDGSCYWNCSHCKEGR